MSLLFSLLFACSYKIHEGQDSPVPLAPADYVLDDWKTSTHCNAYAFGLRFPLFEQRTHGFTPAQNTLPIPDHATATAMYKMLEKNKDAATLAYPQYKKSFSGINLLGVPFFGKKCATVKARPVILKDGPLLPYQPSSSVQETAPAAQEAAPAVKEAAPATETASAKQEWTYKSTKDADAPESSTDSPSEQAK